MTCSGFEASTEKPIRKGDVCVYGRLADGCRFILRAALENKLPEGALGLPDARNLRET